MASPTSKPPSKPVQALVYKLFSNSFLTFIYYRKELSFCQGMAFLFYLKFLSSIANLNSTPIWNLILQIHLLSIVEFNLSEPSVKIMVINMTVSSQQEGTTYG